MPPTKMPPDIATYLTTLGPAERTGIDALRALVREAAPALDESVKWNAPSYALAGDDRVTLGLERKGGWRLVLHRGAAVKDDAAKFVFEDADKVATWPAKDRGVVIVRTLDELEKKRAAVRALVARWIAATTNEAT